MIIDIENDVFTAVSEAIREEYTDIAIYGETILAPSVFPCVCIEETDNYVPYKYVDSEFAENYVSVTYEVNIYSNKNYGKKSEAKAILNIVDSKMLELGFRRTLKNPVQLNDSTVYRLFSRYEAVVSDDKIIYGG